jgi:3-oxoacyl-[acyl-carrier-protein] synthase II
MKPQTAGARKGQRKVLITGVGAITCIGQKGEGIWSGIRGGKTGIRKLQRFDPTSYHARTAGEIPDFKPLDYFESKRIRRLDRYAQLALVCAKMAFEDAGLQANPVERHPRWGASMGTALGGVSEAEDQHRVFMKDGVKGINPMLALLVFGGSSSSNISIEFGLTGPCSTSSNSCASGNIAIGEALRYIRDGYADLMLAGGAEAPLCPLTYAAFDVIKTMSSIEDPEQSCCPFNAKRDGFVMAEGAGMLVLESEEHAHRRGAKIYGEVLGYSLNSDAYHMTGSLPTGECAARCMQDALKDAQLGPDEIDYVNAHGSSTPMNDRNETTALKLALGPSSRKVAISGTKAYHGHALGATAAIEAVICALSLQHQYIPPTIHLKDPDPECDLDYTPLTGKPARIDRILSSAFGFGGINSSIVLGRYNA